MVGRFATVIIQNDGASERSSDENSRQRREQKRKVGRREDMHDVGAGELSYEKRKVDQFVDNRPEIFDSSREAKSCRRDRVDGDEPRVDVRTVAPPVENSMGLD